MGVAVGVAVTTGATVAVGVAVAGVTGAGALVSADAHTPPPNRAPARAMDAPLMASVFFCMADTLFHPDEIKQTPERSTE